MRDQSNKITLAPHPLERSWVSSSSQTKLSRTQTRPDQPWFGAWLFENLVGPPGAWPYRTITEDWIYAIKRCRVDCAVGYRAEGVNYTGISGVSFSSLITNHLTAAPIGGIYVGLYRSLGSWIIKCAHNLRLMATISGNIPRKLFTILWYLVTDICNCRCHGSGLGP